MTEFLSFLVAGIVFGAIYAVSASGLVVTYNTTGIFNFAHGAMGMVLAYVFWQLWQGWGLPELVALVVTLFVAAPLLGIVVERVVMRPLYGAATSIRLAVTLGLLLVLVALAGAVWNPTTNTYDTPELLSGNPISVAGITLSWEQLITVGVAIAVAVFLRVFFRRTRTGVAMRAVVDDPGLASLSGAPSGRIAAYAWMIGVMLAGLGGILLAPSVQGMNIQTLTQLVIYGYAAAVVGRLRSLPMTFLGAMILGVANSMAIGYAPQGVRNDVDAALPMAMLFLALLFIPEVRLAIGRVVRVRPSRVASARMTLVGAVVIVVLVVGLGAVLNANNLYTMGSALALSLLALSLVPLSGYAGQVSLCQFTFLGIGAVVMHAVGGGGSVLGLLAAVGVCAGVGAVLALPTLRLRGLYLALATLAFAVLMDNVFFQSSSIMGIGGTVSVGRPDIFGMHFTTNRAFDVFLAVVLALCVIGVGALRRGRFGRRLVGMNDSPAACSTVGLSLTITKLAVFAFSAGMAGLAGALYGGLNTSVGAAQFDFLFSIAIFVGVTLSGVSLLSGAVLAGLFVAVGPVIGAHIPQIPNFTQLLIGVGVVTIGRNPNGIGTLYAEVSNFWTRRHGRDAPIVDQLSPVLAPAEATMETGVRSVV
ncbi:MAG TPA: ABC transporter permease [Acidimicrobiales bacterium]|nr:ABC transporter permease [Acidimicrobiales bacterium]HLN42156.1 ABC transporter permease [Acidimicrobiales bacterium]